MRYRPTHREQRDRYWGQPIPLGMKHGPTSRAYRFYGCDCRSCLPSGKRRSPWGERRRRPTPREQRDRYWGLPVPEGNRHGPKTNASRFYGCDCRLCLPSGQRKPKGDGRATHAERQKKLREAKRGHPVPPGTRHGIYAQRVYGCTCEVCSAAISRQRHRKKNPWMYRDDLRGRWRQGKRNGQIMDVLCWPPASAGPQWACECERSVAA